MHVAAFSVPTSFQWSSREDPSCVMITSTAEHGSRISEAQGTWNTICLSLDMVDLELQHFWSNLKTHRLRWLATSMPIVDTEANVVGVTFREFTRFVAGSQRLGEFDVEGSVMPADTTGDETEEAISSK